MIDNLREDGYLTGKLLVAMPQMLDERFVKTVIYICAHTEDGAMGLVVNKVLEDIGFPDLLEQLDLRPSSDGDDICVHFGVSLQLIVSGLFVSPKRVVFEIIGSKLLQLFWIGLFFGHAGQTIDLFHSFLTEWSKFRQLHKATDFRFG